MDLNKSNYDKEILYVIDKNGIITSVTKVKGESMHWEPYSRLNEKLRGIFGNITKKDQGMELANRVSKYGFINIFPIGVYDLSQGFAVVFPLEKTECQLESLMSLYSVLKSYDIGYYEKPNFKNNYLNDKEDYIEGIGKLREFVEKQLEELKKIALNNKIGDNHERRIYITRM